MITLLDLSLQYVKVKREDHRLGNRYWVKKTYGPPYVTNLFYAKLENIHVDDRITYKNISVSNYYFTDYCEKAIISDHNDTSIVANDPYDAPFAYYSEEHPFFRSVELFELRRMANDLQRNIAQFHFNKVIFEVERATRIPHQVLKVEVASFL
uniref:Uncharacterized protein n=1 Tax=viral metagenome TaxID=1070528 RepID=A0A6C0I3Q4_9ZZZZ